MSTNVQLSDSVSALGGISAGGKDILHELGIFTVMDLASSAIFMLASQIEKATHPIISNREPRSAVVPAMDLIDLEYRSLPLEQLAEKPVSVIRSIGKVISEGLEQEMGIKTVADLARWHPYETAKAILSRSFGGMGTLWEEDPEMPSDLIPGTGLYPTERVQYDVILLDKIFRPNAVPTSKSPVEKEFTLLDVNKHKDTGFMYPALGVVLTFNQCWYTLGLTLGHLLHSVALAPGESTRIAVVDWSRWQSAGTMESISENELLNAQMTHNRAISEVTSAVAEEAQTGFSNANNFQRGFSQGTGGGLFGIGSSFGMSAGESRSTSISSTIGRRNVAAEMSQNISDRTQQAANAVRNRRASIVREVSQQESETLSTRAITNFNHMHALTVQYYEVVQLYRTTVELASVTRCLLLPMKVLDFTDLDLVRRFKTVIRQATFSQEIRDILRDDLSLSIRGSWGPNGLGPEAHKKEEAWYRNAKKTSLLELNGENIGHWYVPRTVGIHGYSIKYPKEAKALEFIVRYTNGDVNRDSLIQSQVGGLTSVWSHFTPLSAFSSFEIQFALDQPQGVTLPIETEIELYLNYMGRLFSYRHIVQFGGDYGAGNLGQEFPLVTIKLPPSEELVIAHLQENALYYSQAIWRSMDNASLVALLENYTFQGKPLSEVVDFTPIATVGNYLAFAFHTTDDDDWKEFLAKHKDLDLENIANRVQKEEIVPIPSGGVFAEAVLGRFNCAEKLDFTRFWDWQSSSIPITAPEIASLQAQSRVQAEGLTPGQLGQPVLNIVNSPSVPDPTGINSVLNAISNGNMFRDMSASSQTINAAMEILKAGYTASGQSQEVAVKFAEQAVKLLTELISGDKKKTEEKKEEGKKEEGKKEEGKK